MTPGIRVHRLRTFPEREIVELAEVLVDCVEGGASVSFTLEDGLSAPAAP